MKKIIIIMLLSVLTFIYGCKKNNPVKPQDNSISNPIMPLDVGNQWIMKFTNNYTSNPVSIIDTINVKKDTTINSETWYILKFFQYFGEGEITVTNRTDGLYEFYQDSTLHYNLWFKYPSKPGDRYQYNNNTYEVISVKDTVTVPAGQFICYHYESPFWEYWFSPNVGIIKDEEYALSSNSRIKLATIELVKYNVK